MAGNEGQKVLENRKNMREILIFSGTGEGRNLAELLAGQNRKVTVCVATEYGEEQMDDSLSDFLTVHTGRMDEEEMELFLTEKDWQAVVDATHPFATEVSENIAAACSRQGRKPLRLLRQDSHREPDREYCRRNKILFVDTHREAIAYLNQTIGNIFLTTGGNSLGEYVQGIADISRIYVRLLPGSQQVEQCRNLGLKGKQIICMQGPFSEKLNIAMMEELNISVQVTKETGETGGYPQKLAAARQVGAETVVIRRPKEQGYSMGEVLQKLGLEYVEESAEEPVPGHAGEPVQKSVPEYTREPVQKPVPGHAGKNLQQPYMEQSPDSSDIISRRVTIAGMGMGSISNMTGEVYSACEHADVIIGAARMLETVKGFGKPMENRYKSSEIADFILEHPEYGQVVVLLSGDVGFYSGAKGLFQAFGEAGITEEHRYEVKSLCGISSAPYMASRLGIPWEDMVFMSLHGRQQNVIGTLNIHEKLFVLMDGAGSVRKLSQELLQYGLGMAEMHVGWQLSYPEEEIISGKPEQFLDFDREGLLAVLLVHEKAKETPVSHGIPDETFVRGKVPMTKEEVRSVSMAKLALQRDSLVCDIGAGTGSIAVECAGIALQGRVWAIEKNPEALDLIERNKQCHRAWNVETIAGEAPEALEGLPAPTHAFIGGSSGKLRDILEALWRKSPKVRIVLNIISLETLKEVLEVMEEHGFAHQEIVQVTVARARELGRHHLMMGQNPVYVITLQK